MSSQRIQTLIYTVLCWPAFSQGTLGIAGKPEIINLGWNCDKVKPGIAAVLVEENGLFSVRNIILKVTKGRSENEDEAGSYLVTVSLPKSGKAILAWRGIKQIKANKRVLEIRIPPIPPNPDEYLVKSDKPINSQIVTVKDHPIAFIVDRLSPDKEKITIRCGTTQQVIFDSFPHHSGYWWVVWAGDLDGDGKLDLITEHEGFGEYMQARVVTLWLSSLAGGNEVLGVAGSRTISVSGD